MIIHLSVIGIIQQSVRTANVSNMTVLILPGGTCICVGAAGAGCRTQGRFHLIKKKLFLIQFNWY